MQKTCRATRALFLIAGLGISSWAPMIPFAQSKLNLDEGLLGLILLAFGIGSILIMPVTGWLIHKYGSRLIIGISGPIMIGCLPLLAFAPSALFLSLCLFLFGLSFGALNVSMNSQSVAVEIRMNQPLMSGFHCLFSLGGLFGAVTISLLLEAGFSLLTCASCVAAFIALLLFSQYRHLLKDDIVVTPVQQTKFALPKEPFVYLMGILCFISFLAEGAMLDWSAIFLRSTHDYDVSLAGLGYAMFSIAMALGRWMGDRLIQRYGPYMILQMGSLLAAAGLLIALNMPWGHLELVGFFLVGLGASNIVPTLFSASGKIPNVSPSLALTIMTTLGYIGILLGPALIGFAAQATSLSIALTGVALLLIVAGISIRSLPLTKAAEKAPDELFSH
jgi:predicted MFS family arabinose efflux permease